MIVRIILLIKVYKTVVLWPIVFPTPLHMHIVLSQLKLFNIFVILFM